MHTIASFVRGNICCILLITTGAVLLVLDAGGCAKGVEQGSLSKLKPCRVPGVDEELLCGKLTVFENRKTRTGRTIDLNIVVLPALDKKHKAEPLFDLAGGPGAASTMQQISGLDPAKRIGAGTTWC